MTTIDRTWSGVSTFNIVWPLELPEVAEIENACHQVAGDAPFRLVECTGEDADDLLDAAVRLADPIDLDGLAFAVFHAPQGLVVAHSHQRGDGAVSAALRDRLLAAMGVGALEPPVLDRPMSLRRCGAALAGYWAPRPWRAVRARRYLQVRRAAVTRPARGRRRDPVAAQPRTTLVTVPADAVAELAAATKARGVRISPSMALLYAVWSAHAASGQSPSGQVQVMVGLRRYSRLLADVGGNMVGRIVLPVEPGTTAGLAAFGRSVRRWVDSGEPLFVHTAKLGVVRARSAASVLRRGAEPRWESSWQEGGVDLVWSDRGGSGRVGARDVRWSRDHPESQRCTYTLVRPVGLALAVNVGWVGSAACLSLTYDAGAVDATPVLDMLARSPARCVRELADA